MRCWHNRMAARHLFAARHLQTFAHLPVITADYEIRIVEQKLCLYDPRAPQDKPLCVDFLSGKNAYRQHQTQGIKSLLAKAVGCKSGYRPHVLDATAGLADDSFALACYGCKVMMLERCELIAALLSDGLHRLQHNDDQDLSIQLLPISAQAYFSTMIQQQRPDVIYLDPMFDNSKRHALNKKSMRMLARLVGKDDDAASLLQPALQHARRRVVIKRHRLAPTLTQRIPSLVFSGKAVRFDVYLCAGVS